ncbi:MAG: hypothetical protein UY09_C0017G0012 [Parcubacteria group bacterium GW2011_GWA2_47_8]|nr:MAG: hypothetical protein UY09_C0017G0012 [Parcubacteria group bacterium GW2011_GWA2_47_8]OHB20804.1 MAG: hypothetical protein A2666_04300 [Parcubacteria group bacterium RIFCSPHIGHO2_01_FULL_47_10b]
MGEKIQREHIDTHHEALTVILFDCACEALGLEGYTCRSLRRKSPRGTVLRSYRLGYINLRKKVVTLEMYTYKERRPRSYPALLRTISHELAHVQRPPYRQFFKGRWINRIHYPEFYQQVKQNIVIFKQHPVLQPHFEN